jgi:hypothetical protein
MSYYKEHRVSILLLSGFVLLMLCVWIAINILEDLTGLPPEGVTRTTMILIDERIFIYIHENGRLPQKLEQLPYLHGFYNSIKDGWGNSILYSFDTNGGITLKSYGADGQPGGTGKSEDTIKSFPTKDTNGNWLQ